MAGMAVFATLSVDDLARIAAKKLQETEATKGIGDTLAKEFRGAGVALANDGFGVPRADPPCNQTDDCDLCCENQQKARDKECKNSGCLIRSAATFRACLLTC